ncbi:MAG TPA: AraC family transcriptional regulator [Gammaproteobacteria bacterium]
MALNLYTLPANLESTVSPGIPDFGVSFIYEGHVKGQCVLNDAKPLTRELGPGSILLYDRCNSLQWTWQSQRPEDSPVRAVSIYLPPELLKKITLETLDKDSKGIELPNNIAIQDNFVSQLALELKNEAEQSTVFGKLFGETAAQLLAIHLLRKHCTIRREAPECRFGLSRSQLENIREYIDTHLDLDISLETLARLCGLSAYHFARMFKVSTGLPPHQYVIKRRLEKAKQLLSDTTLPILHIAMEVGYESHSHFTSIFKKAVGCSPSEFRRRI